MSSYSNNSDKYCGKLNEKSLKSCAIHRIQLKNHSKPPERRTRDIKVFRKSNEKGGLRAILGTISQSLNCCFQAMIGGGTGPRALGLHK